MKNILIVCFVFLGFTNLYSQNLPDTAGGYVHEPDLILPKFPGDINTYINDNIEYPDSARDAGIQGTVYIQFIVEKDGKVDSIKVLRGVSGFLGSSLNIEAMRVISKMPVWKPAMKDGKPFEQKFTVPIRFIIEDKKKH